MRAEPMQSARIAGFTYLSLLILIAILSMVAVATLQLGAAVQRDEAERQLLATGAEFRAAFASYAAATPAGQPGTPQSLADLLRDPRYPEPRHYLRKLYADPLTGKPEWGTVPAPDGRGIVGVYSLAPGHPLKIARFDEPFHSFEAKTAYGDWVFSILVR